MTDHKVLVFGSFTDNEIKSLQRHPRENDVEIRFGSLDSATLKSVGLFNTIPRDLERSKGFRLSKLVNGKNAIDTPKEIELPILATTSDEKGSIHNSSPLSGSDGVKELKTNNNVEPSVSCLSGNVSDPLNQSSPKQNGTEDVNISSEPPKEIESPILATSSDEKGSIHNSSPLSGSDGVKELKTNSNVELSVSCLSGNVSDPLNQSSPKQNGTEDVNILPEPLKNEASIDSSQVLDLVDSKENILKASNGPSATIGNLLPRGFVNLGNLCFLNATLQALLSCSPFVHLLQELRTHNMPQIGYPTLRAFVEFISDFDMLLDSSSKKKEAVLETGRPLRPVMFESVLKIFSPDVPNNLSGRPRQEDAQEFLSFIMHQMHDELLKLESQFSNGNGEKTSLVSSMNGEDDDDNWETVGPKNKTAITRTQSFIPSKLSAIFGGQLRSVVKARGNKASATIQPFLLLPLNICPEQVCTIEDALRLFSAQETLEGYRASAAGKAEVVSASKSVKISELPEIMILHLVRFSYGSQGSTKLHKPVRFPLELVLGRELLVSPSSEGRRYELVATITHHGRDPSKGHYTADSRHFPSGKWLRYDDAAVTPIPTSKVLHDQAYVLFYRHL